MKILGILLMSLGLILVWSHAQETVVPKAIIEVQPDVYHIGKIPDSQIVSFAFTLVNHSSQKMKIERVTVSCGCTVLEQNFQEVEPGQSTQLNVKFDPKGRRGYARWEILVFTNVPQAPIVMAPFDVEILKEGMLSHEVVSFGEFQRGLPVECDFWIAPANTPDFKIEAVEVILGEPGISSFDVQITSEICEDFYPGTRKAAHIKLVAKKDIPYGRHEGIVRVTTNIPGYEKIELPILAKVAGIIGVRPDYVRMDNIVPGESVIRRVLVYHREGKSFQIVKIESTLPFLATGVVPVLEDQYYQVLVSIKKDAVLTAGEFRGQLTIYNTSEEMPKITIPVQGLVMEKPAK